MMARGRGGGWARQTDAISTVRGAVLALFLSATLTCLCDLHVVCAAGGGTAAIARARGDSNNHASSVLSRRSLIPNAEPDPNQLLAAAIQDKNVKTYELRQNVVLGSSLPALSGKDFAIIGKCGSNGQQRCIIDGADKYRGLLSGGDYVTLTVVNLEFTRLRAMGDNGAAIYMTGGLLVVKNCLFRSNKANAGGAIEVRSNQRFEISGSSFEGNEAAFAGGAVAIGSEAQGKVVGTTFSRNVAENGGAISCVEGVATFDSVRFEYNIARESGGAVALDTAGVRFIKTTFESNSATSGQGGAVFLELEFHSCAFCTGTTFSGNTAKESASSNVAIVGQDGNSTTAFFCAKKIPAGVWIDPQAHVVTGCNGCTGPWE